MNNEIDFSQAQRQSVVGILINSLIYLKEIIKAVIFPLLIVLIKGKTEMYLSLGLGFGVLFFIALIYGYFYYLRFTFRIDNEKSEFVINKGVFRKSRLSIPLEKIQLVELNQNLIQRMIGVFSIEIDTAGTEKREAKIHSISYSVAQGLKSVLSTKNETTTNTPTPALTVASESLIQIDTETIIRVGLTSNYAQSFWLLISFGIATYHQMSEFLPMLESNQARFFQIIQNGLSFISIGILFIFLLVVMLGINLVRTLIKYYHLSIHQKENSLTVTSGLFGKKNSIIRPNKVQIARISQNYFQKKFNFSQISFQQAHAGKADTEKHQKGNNLLIPGCNPSERDKILQLIFNQIPNRGEELKPNVRFLNLPLLFRLILPLIIYGIVCYFVDTYLSYYPWVLTYAIFILLVNYFNYCRHRLYVNENYIIKQGGAWEVTTDIIEPHKIQAIKTYQYPWHKKLDIGHVNLYTAAGTIHFKFGNFSEIKRHCNHWLYQIESSSKNWM